MSLLPIELPEKNKRVRAIIKRCNTWDTNIVNLINVDEDDCNWRFVEDNAELAYAWDVVYWEYL